MSRESNDGAERRPRVGALIALGLSTGSVAIILAFAPAGVASSGILFVLALSAAAVFGPPRLARFLGAAPLLFALAATAWALFCAAWLAEHG